MFWSAFTLAFSCFLLYRLRVYLSVVIFPERTATWMKIAFWGVTSNPTPFWHRLACIESDVYVSMAIGIVFEVVGYLLSVTTNANGKRRHRWAGLLALFAILYFIQLVCVASYRLFYLSSRGLEQYLSGFFVSSARAAPIAVTREVLSWVEISDFGILLVVTPVLVWCVRWSARRSRLGYVLAGLVAFVSILCGRWDGAYFSSLAKRQLPSEEWSNPSAYFQKIPPQLATNPLLQVFRSLITTWTREQSLLERAESLPNEEQRLSVRLEDPLFASPQPSPRFASIARFPTGSPPFKNVLFFIIESGSYQHMLGEGAEVMPSLVSLAKSGISFTHHYTSMPYTPSAVASMFTGLYPGNAAFDLPGWNFPTLFTLLRQGGADPQLLWVTNGSFYGFFPGSLLQRDVPLEVWDIQNLEKPRWQGPKDFVVDEKISFDLLLRRLGELDPSRPFAAAYYSYSTHFPYLAFAPRTDLLFADTSKAFNRYRDALHLADSYLGRTVEFLRSIGRLDDTLIIVTSDHGESFGEIPFHGPQLTQEVIQTPLVLYNPHLQPMLVDAPTSHVDITPTVLDLLGVRYDPARFHGESLVSGALRREYLFAESTFLDLAVVGSDLRKSVVKFRAGECAEVDLRSDAAESRPSPCDQESSRFRAAMKYRNYINAIIPAYNASLGR